MRSELSSYPIFSRSLWSRLILPTALILSVACETTEGPRSVECGPPTIDSNDGDRLFYEIFDLDTGAVWGTPEFTPEEFAALKLPEGYLKNQPREASVDSGQFARSPDCANDGEFTEEELFGKDFQHVVNLLSPGQPFDESGLLNGSQVFKYQRVEFLPGRDLYVLISPDGARYVRVSRDAVRSVETPTVPAGWSLTSYLITENLTVELAGTIDVLRADNQDSFQGPIAGDIALTDHGVRQSIRGVRTCELMELAIVDDILTFVAWNEGFLHDCPDEWLAAVDRTRYGVGGPRWRSIDAIEQLDSDGHTIPEPEEIVAEVPSGLGYDMLKAAEVPFIPIADLEVQLGITIETIEDIPVPVRQNLLADAISSDGYQVFEVARAEYTSMTHHAGAQIFTLNDGQCRYAMKFYTNVTDPELTDEAAIATLGQRFTQLSPEFSFEVITLEEDLVIAEVDGTAHVIADEFGNSYDRYTCQ